MMEHEQRAGQITDQILLPFQAQLTFELYERIWAAVYARVLELLR